MNREIFSCTMSLSFDLLLDIRDTQEVYGDDTCQMSPLRRAKRSVCYANHSPKLVEGLEVLGAAREPPFLVLADYSFRSHRRSDCGLEVGFPCCRCSTSLPVNKTAAWMVAGSNGKESREGGPPRFVAIG
jgi:hypothetical protein